MIPAMQSLSDAILALHDAYANSPEWDELMGEDEVLKSKFCDLMDFTLWLNGDIAEIVSRAEGDIVTKRILTELGFDKP